MLTAGGESAFYSGEKTLGVNNALSGENCVAAGNMLADPNVIVAMINAFEQQSGHLADRLIAAMHAGLRAGGESRSAAFGGAVDRGFSRLADSGFARRLG